MFLFCFQYTLMTKHCRWKPVGKKTEFSMKSRSLSPCYYTKGALTHHPKGQWYFLRKSCALRGRCGCCGSLQTMPQPLQVLLSSSAQVSVVSVLETACDLPANKPATGSFAAEMDGRSARPFSLLRKRNRKRKNEVNTIWQFTIWKRRWSAGAQDAPPWLLPLI